MQEKQYRPCDVAECATNVTELLYDNAWQALLNLYTATIGAGRELFSDYDRFLAVCEMMPLMQGHDERARCESILALTPQSAPEIWRRVADWLLVHPCPPIGAGMQTIVPKWQTDAFLPYIPSAPTVSADRFLARDVLAWQMEIAEMLETCTGGVRVVLPKGFCFCNPDRYHVGVALKQRGEADADLLTAQLIRVLCIELQKTDCALQLTVNCDACEAVALLSSFERTVGLPSVYWTCRADCGALLNFSMQAHKHAVLPLLCGEDDEVQKTAKAYAREFPIGLIGWTSVA